MESQVNLPIDYPSASWYRRKLARMEYIKRQGGKCYHCGAPLEGAPAQHILNKPINPRLFPAGFFSAPVHLHHDHKTGQTIGAVHNLCNAVLWQYHGE